MASGGNQSRGLSRALKLVEQKCRREHHGHDGQETKDDLHTTSSRGERMVLYMMEGSYHCDQDRELENLQRQVRELELEVRSERQRRSPEGLSYDHNSISAHIGRSSHQSHS